MYLKGASFFKLARVDKVSTVQKLLRNVNVTFETKLIITFTSIMNLVNKSKIVITINELLYYILRRELIIKSFIRLTIKI